MFLSVKVKDRGDGKVLVPWKIGEFDEKVTFTELCSKIMEAFRDKTEEYTIDRVSLGKSQVERMNCMLPLPKRRFPQE